MLRFKVFIDIEASAPEDDEMKKVFMQNAEDIIQQGLAVMTVPDWTVHVVDIEEEE